MMISGTVAFSNTKSQDQWKGQDTGYSLTVTLSDEDAAILESQGVMVKDYENTKQRKFKSAFQPEFIDLEGDPVDREIPRGSKVRMLISLSKEPHMTWGISTYLDKVRLVELAESAEEPADF